MALQDAVIPIDFGQGLDTKTDPKRVAVGKFQTLQNAIFTNKDRITKRNGYDVITNNIVGGGTLTAPKMVKNCQNELVCADSGRLYSYSPTLLGWEDKGKYNSISVSNLGLTASSGGAENCQSAVMGNLQLFTYDNKTTSVSSISVVDNQTGVKLLADFILTGQKPTKPILLGSTQLAVIYRQPTTTFLTISLVTATLAGNVVVGAGIVLDATAPLINFDVITTSTGAVIAYSVGTTLKLITIDTTGAITHSASITSAGIPSPIQVSASPNGNIWVYWADSTSTASETLYYATFTSTLAAQLGKTTIITGQRRVYQISTLPLSVLNTTQTLYYSTYAQSAGAQGYDNPSLHSVSLSSLGVVGVIVGVMANVELYSRPFFVGSKVYMAVMYLSELAATGFLLDTSDFGAVAKFLQDRAEGLAPVAKAFNSFGTRDSGMISVVQSLGNSQYSLACSYIESIQSTAVAVGSSGPVTAITQCDISATNIVFDFNDIDANQSLTAQDLLVLNGGIVSVYDGSNCVELGFNYSPSYTDITASGSGGGIAAGTYIYYVIYVWKDAMGNLYQSAPSNGYQVNTSGGTSANTIYPLNYLITQKQSVSRTGNLVQIKIYRTLTTGTIAYLINTEDNGNISNYDIAYVDTSADSAIQNNPTLYTEGLAVLENIAPPPAMVMWENYNRVWVVDSESPETTVEYSKTAAGGTGIEFSTGQLEMIVDSKGGAISGASPMDEKTVLLKDSALGYFIGDGANDSGTGATISTFQYVPADVGCTNSKSVLLYPEGLIFRSTKGIYQLGRGVNVNYIGADVEAYNSQDIYSARIVGNKNQIRFLTSSGSSLLYDYAFKQWSTFTNHTGYSGDVWNGVYVYARTDGSIFQENTTTFLDNGTAFAVGGTTAWIVLQSVQNFERLRWLLTLGDYANGSSALHGVQISAAYDFSSSYSTGPIYYFGAASGSGPFQYRNFFARQKCDAISLQISELTTGVSGEYIDLTNMSFVAAIKKGSNKMPASASVG